MKNVFSNGKYIKPIEQYKEFSLYQPLPLFRKEFEINNKANNAIITVQSPGFACYYINGQPITSDLFISPLSNYSKLLWYNVYDVTSLLKIGKNTIGVILGNGLYNESFITTWDYHLSPWRDSPTFCLNLCVDGKDVVCSDQTWKYSIENSPIIYSHLRSGEYFDARKKDDSWLYSGYNDNAWKTPTIKDISSEVIFKQTKCQPVREVECITPIRIEKNKSGYMVDFGKNMSGYAEFTIQEKRDTQITFKYCEEIDDNLEAKFKYVFYGDYESRNKGKPDVNEFGIDKYQEVFYKQSPFHTNKMIASGGVDTFKPKFSYHGYRYVCIEGLTKKPNLSDVKGYFVHQDVERTANFECGDNLLNYIYTAGIRSTYSNMFWSLTDCPTREKFGWTNDAAATCEQILINFNVKPLFEKWFEDLKIDMRSDGSLPGIIPSNGWGDDWGPVCDNLLFELPYRTYVYTGDDSALINATDCFEKYVEFLWNKKLQNHEFILGDWTGNGSSELTPKEFVRDFFLIKALRVTILALKLKNKDYKKYQDKLDVIQKEFINTYNDKDGYSKVVSQTALAMLIEGKLYIDRDKVVKQLISTVEKDEFKLTCGMVGVQYLYDALTNCGKPDYVYKIITQSEPGYKTWFENGATTLWECWDGVEKGSHNHHMFSNVLAWFFKSLLGINIENNKTTFKNVELKPCFIKEIKYVKGYIDTPYGKISSEWNYNGSQFEYQVNIPSGINVTYKNKPLKAGLNKFIIGD